jgi:hypothetical protein
MPGEEEYSTEWKCKVPKAMDTGENRRWPSENTPVKSLVIVLGRIRNFL